MQFIYQRSDQYVNSVNINLSAAMRKIHRNLKKMFIRWMQFMQKSSKLLILHLHWNIHSLLILELLSLSSPTIRLQFSQQFTANERRTEEQFLSEFIFLWLWEKHMEPCSKYAVFFVCGRCHFKWSRTTEHLSLTKESCPICGTCTSAPHSVSTTFSKWFDFHICQPWL